MFENVKGLGTPQIDPIATTPSKKRKDPSSPVSPVSPSILKKAKKDIENRPNSNGPIPHFTKEPNVDAIMIDEVALSVFRPINDKKKRLAIGSNVAIKRSKHKHKTVPNKIESTNVDVCYSNSLIKDICKSKWFKEEQKKVEDINVSQSTLNEIINSLPDFLKNDVVMIDENEQRQFNIINFSDLAGSLIKQVLNDISPSAKNELINVLKIHFIKDLDEAFTSCDDENTIAQTVVEELIEFAIIFGWITDGEDETLENYPEFLNFLVTKILGFEGSKWVSVSGPNSEIKVFYLMPITIGDENAAPRGLNQSDIEGHIEPFDSVDCLFRYITEKHDKSDNLVEISEKLEKYLNDLEKLGFNNSDVSYQLLSSVDIKNLTAETWDNIKRRSRYNHYEKQLTNEIKSFISDKLDTEKKQLRKIALEEIVANCGEIVETNVYKTYLEMLNCNAAKESFMFIAQMNNLVDMIITNLKFHLANSFGLVAIYGYLKKKECLVDEEMGIIECIDNFPNNVDLIKFKGIIERLESRYSELIDFVEEKEFKEIYKILKNILGNFNKVEESTKVAIPLCDFFVNLKNNKCNPEVFEEHCNNFSKIKMSEAFLPAQNRNMVEGQLKIMTQHIKNVALFNSVHGRLVTELDGLQKKYKTFEMDFSAKDALDSPTDFDLYENIEDKSVYSDSSSIPGNLKAKSKKVKLSGPGGIVNGRNICYGNSLINALRMSNWFRNKLKEVEFRRILSQESIAELLGKVPPLFKNRLEKTENGEKSFDLEGFARIPDHVKKSLMNKLTPSTLAEFMNVLKADFVDTVLNIFETIESNYKVGRGQIDRFRSVVRNLGWKPEDNETQQQDAQEFLGYILGEILGFKESKWCVVPNYDFGVTINALKDGSQSGHFLPLKVSKEQPVLNQLINDCVTGEDFEPAEYLYRQIVVKYRDSNDLNDISHKLKSLRDLLQAQGLDDSDATYQLLSSYDIENLTPEIWGNIKEAVLYNYMEKQLVVQIESFKRDKTNPEWIARKKNSLQNEIVKYCGSIINSPAYKAYFDVLNNEILQPSSMENVNRITTILDKVFGKVENDNILESKSKIIELYKTLKDNGEDVDVMQCLAPTISDGEEVFELQKIKDALNALDDKYGNSAEDSSYKKAKNALIQFNAVDTNKKLLEELLDIFEGLKSNVGKQEAFEGYSNRFSGIEIPENIPLAKSALGFATGLLKKQNNNEVNFDKLEQELQSLKQKYKILGIKVSSRYTLDADNIPQTLPISLNRYNSDNGLDVNLDDPIEPSATIEFKLSGDSNEFAKYELKAVVVHHGRNTKSGHYLTYVPQPNGNWMEHNDELVRPVDDKDCSSTIQSKGYVYIYEYVGKVQK